MTAFDQLLVRGSLVFVWWLIEDFMKAIAETMMIGDSSVIGQQVAMCSDKSAICSAIAIKKLSLRPFIILSSIVFVHHGTQKKPINPHSCQYVLYTCIKENICQPVAAQLQAVAKELVVGT